MQPAVGEERHEDEQGTHQRSDVPQHRADRDDQRTHSWKATRSQSLIGCRRCYARYYKKNWSMTRTTSIAGSGGGSSRSSRQSLSCNILQNGLRTCRVRLLTFLFKANTVVGCAPMARHLKKEQETN